MAAPPAGRDEAEALLDEAFEADDPDEQAALARAALERWPDAVDAHLILADHAADPAEALARRRAAVDAAERVVARLAPGGGRLPDGVDPRAWSRARTSLAEALLVEGGEASLCEARQHLEVVLRRAPAPALEHAASEGGGPRALLAACLLELGDDAACQEVLRGAPEAERDSAWVAWTEALLALRRGDPARARERAHEAWGRNPHVPSFLLGRRRLPDDVAGRVIPGEPLEAALHVLAQGAVWRSTPGALGWLAALPPPAEEPPALAPEVAQDLRALEQDPAEVWQVGWRRLPRWVEHEGQRTRPWLAVAVASAGPAAGDVVAADMTIDPPTHAELLEALASGMQRPRAGGPRRPGRVEVGGDEQRAALSPALASIGVGCERAAALEVFDAVVSERARRMLAASNEPPGPLAALEPERLRALCATLAALYRAAPWASVPDDRLLSIDTPAGARSVAVLGAAGLTYGLLVGRDEERLRAAAEHGPSGPGTLAVLFEPPERLTLAELEALEAHGAEVAAEDAYPLLVGDPSELPALEAVASVLYADRSTKGAEGHDGHGGGGDAEDVLRGACSGENGE